MVKLHILHRKGEGGYDSSAALHPATADGTEQIEAAWEW
jgi:hypothetical protein